MPVHLTRNLRPLVDAGWLVLGPGADGRSRLITSRRRPRQAAGGAAPLARGPGGLNDTLGVANVVALHALIDDCMARLAPAPEGETDDE
jgi:hypothetical protein